LSTLREVFKGGFETITSLKNGKWLRKGNQVKVAAASQVRAHRQTWFFTKIEAIPCFTKVKLKAKAQRPLYLYPYPSILFKKSNLEPVRILLQRRLDAD
jgi:hypothetical protein